MRNYRRVVAGSLLSFPVGALGCSGAPGVEPTDTVEQASVKTPQNELAGDRIPQFVEPLPALSGTRINANGTVTVDMEEFQQKVLPPQFYPATGNFSKGTYLWGYNINGRGPSWPSRTIEAHQNVATTAIYSNNLRQPNGAPPVLQQFLSQDLTFHWADPIGTSARNSCVQGDENGGTSDAGVIGGTQNAVPPACQVPYAGPVPAVPHLHGAEVLSAYDGHPDAWFTPGLAQRGAGFVSNVYNYPNQQ